MPETFQATPLTLGMFLNQPGQGFYLPIYQRDYAWGADEIRRLFEDFGYGIARLASGHDSATFLGTVLTVEDRNTLHPAAKPAPPSVRQVIDGQQRIITCLAIARELGDRLGKAIGALQSNDTIRQIGEMTANQLEATLTIDMAHGNVPYRFYPKVARAGRDKWSSSGAKAQYDSPIAEYLFSTKLDEKVPASSTAFASAVKAIRSEILNWADDDDVGRSLQSDSFSSEFSKHLLDNEFIPSDDTELASLRIYRLSVLGQFFLKEIQIISVEAPNEEYALALFEPLNTTGQLLTALETFKPLLVDAEGGATGYPGTPTERSYARVALLVDDPKPIAKAKKTADLLVPFALSESGERLSRRLQDQRRYLRRTYTELDNQAKKRSFVESLAGMASFIHEFWDSANPVAAITSLDKTCLGFLRKSGHTIPQGLLARYYSDPKESEDDTSNADLLDALRAVAAFWMLWRTSRASTQNIDAHYRALMSPGIEVSDLGTIGPFCHLETPSPPPVAELKQALAWILSTRGGIADRETWINKITSMNLYGGKALTRFVLLAAHHDTVPDTEDPGLIKAGAKGSSETLNSGHWTADYGIEHIAPQTIADADSSYESEIYDNGLQNRLGNLTLVPQAENSSLGNRTWPEKRFMYSVLGEKDPELRAERLEESGLNIELAPETEELLTRANHLPFCESVALNDSTTWDAEFVRRRSIRLAGLAWDTVEEWLF